jgi:disulfide bond formation protein DsbB
VNLGKRRQRIAQLLLAVFVPVLLLTITHCHTEVEKPAAPCVLCLHHVPHTDLSSGALLALQNCVICHFSVLPYIIPVLIGFIAVALSLSILFFRKKIDYLFVYSPKLHSRAPPYLIF